MGLIIFNKLVRDKIPELMSAAGKIPVTRLLDEKEYGTALRAKLREEVQEFEESGQVEELADILEVVYALAVSEGISPEMLESLREQKCQERGGFQHKVFLVKTLK